MEADEPLVCRPVFAFNRSHLFLGGERELVLSMVLLCIVLIVALQNIYTAMLGGVLLIVSITVARMMAKSDPQLTQTYRRFARYQRFYPSNGMKHYGG
ncbi:conjugal transfer protein TrbD [Photobacterium frigidiphilum]|uniref:Conjugal transfer protein TrbD n=1 Tax=Photobacterium frigidiphilum TaxID=264736 RepID=A0A2T3J747_9GAMM|nr:conjugal transfer protein TrbD [Photobacterium frigidiphilum]PSU44514.1 conjugal transfer protein TrbD [Photobacterium frigidiphilum]